MLFNSFITGYSYAPSRRDTSILTMNEKFHKQNSDLTLFQSWLLNNEEKNICHVQISHLTLAITLDQFNAENQTRWFFRSVCEAGEPARESKVVKRNL